MQARAAVAPVYRPLVDALPVQNGAVGDPTCDNITKPCLASLTASYSNPSSFDAYSLRLDHTLKQRVTLFARNSHTPSIQGLRTFSQIEYDSLNTDSATAGATVTLSPTKLNDFRSNWGRSYGKAVQVQDNSFGAVPPPPSAIYRPGDSFNGAPALFLVNAPGVSAVGTVPTGSRSGRHAEKRVPTIFWADNLSKRLSSSISSSLRTPQLAWRSHCLRL
jgi:hypothetical protein